MLREVLQFLPCETPAAWVDAALGDIDTLLIDHANCERKAAANAMNLMYRHVARTELMLCMSRLAREELLHFQQVVNLMSEIGIQYVRLGPSRYAEGLRRHIDRDVENGLVDILVIGAYVEARSCERFSLLAPYLDERLGRFYLGLVKSEARHFLDYLRLAELYGGRTAGSRVLYFAELERELVTSPDQVLRFHSGLPAGNDQVRMNLRASG